MGLQQKNKKSYCIDCNKYFTAKRWADLSTAVKCPQCGNSSGVIAKGHPWYPNKDEITKTQDATIEG